MKKLLLATALTLAMSVSAMASVIDSFGPNPTSAAGAFSNDPNGPLVGGLFYDQYTFTLIGTSFVSVVTASNTFAIGGIDGPFGIQNFTGAIYEIVGLIDPLPGGDDILRFGPQAATLCASGLCQELNGNGILQGGDYYLAIAGTAGALAGYGGNLSVAELAETPLPAAVWLFGSALGGGAFMLRRRKQKQSEPLAA
jgi:hypothetical protein